MLDSLGQDPRDGCEDMGIYIGGRAVAIMRIDPAKTVASEDSYGVKSVAIQYMAADPRFRGLGAIMIEKAMQEAVALEPELAAERSVAVPRQNASTSQNPGTSEKLSPRKGPCVVLSAATPFLMDLYASTYGFAPYKDKEYKPGSMFGGRMELFPHGIKRWSRQHNGQYALSPAQNRPVQ